MVRRKPKRSWRNVITNLWGMLFTRAGRAQYGLFVGFGLIVISVAGLIDRSLFSPDEITPEAARFGWNETIAKAEAPRIAAQMPKFAITDEDGNAVTGAGKHAELWKFTKLANGGKHIATWRQESGDCVSMGWSNAIAYRQGFQIAREQRNEILKIPFPPYMYGISRVQIGKRSLGRGAGSIGAWAAQGSQAYGVLPVEAANQLGFTYSGRLADQWGFQGPPQSTVDYARKFRIRTVSQVKSWEDVRDALVHGYPCTVASNVGFMGGHQDRDGKRWLRARGNWGHQMCFIGVEDRPSREKGAYCLNSWGVDAHPRPLNDEPPGGFWVDWQTVQRMVQQGDSWAYSDFDGFPGDAEADWNAFKLEVEAEADEQSTELINRVEQPEEKPFMWEWRKMIPLSLCVILLIAGLGIFLASLFEKHGLPKGSGTVGTILLCAAILAIGDRAFAGKRHRLQMQQQSNYMPLPTIKQTTNSPIPHVMLGSAPWCKYCPQQKAMLQAAEKAGLITKLEEFNTDVSGMLYWCDGGLPTTAWEDSNGKLWRIAGACSIEHLMSEYQRTEALAAKEPKSDPAPHRPQVAELEAFNAFGPLPIESKPEQAWTAFPARYLRSYADCFETESDFVLVIGSETEALMTLETTDKPVAHEVSHPQIDPGTYHIVKRDGRLVKEPIRKQAALHVSSVRVQKPR